jgi:predicted aspartyl protease
MVALRDRAMADGDYAQAARWNREAGGLAGRPLGHISVDVEGAPPQVAEVQSETLRASRGLMGFPRTEAVFGGVAVSALVDTGANYAVISETLARGARLVDLGDAGLVGSAGHVTGGRVTLGDIEMGGSRFRNAIIIVLPDEALQFPLGFRIEAILGMPQIRAFSAIEFSGDRMTTFTSPSESDDEGVADPPNLVWDGAQLFAAVQVDGAPEMFMLDTGARRSSRLVVQQDADMGTISVRGLGGSASVQGRRGSATLGLDDRTLSLGRLETRLAPPRRGCGRFDPTSILGWDALGQGGFRIDFDRMRFDWIDVGAATGTRDRG